MDEKKSVNQSPKIKDEELDAVTGGRGGRSSQQQTKKCATDGCSNQISADSPSDYCRACLDKMYKQGVRPCV